MSGIYLTGKHTCTVIEANKFIGYNKFAGIKLEREASAIITKNKIVRNLA